MERLLFEGTMRAEGRAKGRWHSLQHHSPRTLPFPERAFLSGSAQARLPLRTVTPSFIMTTTLPVAALPPFSKFDDVWTTPAMAGSGRGLAGLTDHTIDVVTRADNQLRLLPRDPSLVSFERMYAMAYRPCSQRTYPILALLSTESLIRLLGCEEVCNDEHRRRDADGETCRPSWRQMRAILRTEERATLEAMLRALADENALYSMFLHGIMILPMDLDTTDLTEWARWHGLYAGLTPASKVMGIMAAQQPLLSSSALVQRIAAHRNVTAEYANHEALTRTGHIMRDSRPWMLGSFYSAEEESAPPEIVATERRWEELGARLGLPLVPPVGGTGGNWRQEEEEVEDEGEDE